jgi:hypothetical protein
MNEGRTKTILNYDRQFDVENWFNFIPNETFNTKFISLTKEEATNLLIYMKTGEKSSKEIVQTIQELCTKIEREIKNISNETLCDGVFVRLGPRRYQKTLKNLI